MQPDEVDDDPQTQLMRKALDNCIFEIAHATSSEGEKALAFAQAYQTLLQAQRENHDADDADADECAERDWEDETQGFKAPIQESEWHPIAASAYRAYAANAGNKNSVGEPLPSWFDLPAAVRNAWEASVRHVGTLSYYKPAPHLEQMWEGWISPALQQEYDNIEASKIIDNAVGRDKEQSHGIAQMAAGTRTS